MRKFFVSLSLAAAGVLGLSTLPAAEAQASVRVYVDLGDVIFSSGRPYHRHSRAPLHVVHYSYGPRYYHYGPPRVVHHYAPPPRVVHHYYAPPPRVRHVHHHHGSRHYAPPRQHYRGGKHHNRGQGRGRGRR